MSDLELKEFDAANYLSNGEDVANFLQAATEIAGDDPKYITQILATIARTQNIQQLAKKSGLSRQGIYKVLSLNSNPSFSTIMKLVNALDLRLSLQSKDERDLYAVNSHKHHDVAYPI